MTLAARANIGIAVDDATDASRGASDVVLSSLGLTVIVDDELLYSTIIVFVSPPVWSFDCCFRMVLPNNRYCPLGYLQRRLHVVHLQRHCHAK